MAPIVPVIKANRTVRISEDFKVTINPWLDVEQYPLAPRPEELFASLRGGKKFTTLDFADAFLQMELDQESQSYLVANTHKGLFKYKRLPFGVCSASALFQRVMDTILQGLGGIVAYQDDILVTGSNTQEHIEHLEKEFTNLVCV